MTRRTHTTLFLALLILPAAFPRAAPCRSVKVEVVGIQGPIKRNVLATLSIAKKSERKRASDAELRHLHARAEEEIRGALQPFGYYRPLIRAELQTDKSWVARYEINPGPPLLLDSVRVELEGEGATDPEFQKRVQRFPLKKGDVLLHPTYEFGKDSLESYAAQGGYLDARFVTNRIVVDLERYTAAIDVLMDTGPRHYFGPVTFDDDFIRPKVLNSFVDFRPGERFDFRKLLQLQADLSGTGYFTKVEINPGAEVDEHRTVPIRVDIAPARKLRFTGGVGYGTDDGPRVRLVTEMRRTNPYGHKAQIELQYGLKDKRAGIQYFIPWPRARTDLLTLATGYQDITTVTSQTKAFQSGVSLSRPLGPWRAVPALNYRREKFTVGVDHGTVATLAPEGTWSRIRADDPLYTKNGDRLRLNVRGANQGLLSDVSFAQVRADAKVIHALGALGRGLARIELGATHTNDFHRLPPTFRFFAGGTNSVRGYAYNSLGARDSLNNIIGGRYLMAGSVELDHRFLPRWGVAAFFDIGNAMQSFSTNLKKGAGVGLRFLSPAGPVRADFAWGLDRANRPLQFHLAVGSEL